MSTPELDHVPPARPSAKAIERAGAILARARAELDALTPEDAAEVAWHPGGPSRDSIAAQIRAMRGDGRGQW